MIYKLRNVDGPKLLDDIIRANAHFHLHHEHDKPVKKRFYNYKDHIIKYIFDGFITSVTGRIVSLDAHDKTSDGAVALVALKSEGEEIRIHVPLKYIKRELNSRKRIPSSVYNRNVVEYQKFDVSEDDFRMCMFRLGKVFHELFYAQIHDMNMADFLIKVRSGASKSQIRPLIPPRLSTSYHPIYNTTIPVKFVTPSKKKPKPLYFVMSNDLIDAVCETGGWDYPKIKDRLIGKNAILTYKDNTGFDVYYKSENELNM